MDVFGVKLVVGTVAALLSNLTEDAVPLVKSFSYDYDSTRQSDASRV